MIKLPFSEAVRESPDGVFIDLEVSPGTKTIRVPSGYNPWRRRIEVRLSEAAQKGKANQQLIEQLAIVLDVKTSAITLIAGPTSHRKTLHIRGVQVDQVLEMLNLHLEKD
ncbi:MAG: DUF167 domain-containing protein [ANME-2 cluster archaeon]|nr:DUF167 domain-containing protein [ANME-2 cluster archaeon]